MIRFCFITGITRFSQVSIFSTLNNLMNITMHRDFANICGITETELHEQLSEDVAIMADDYGCSVDDMFGMLKRHYDGYHFTEKSEGLYNPYSLFNAFLERRIKNYWFESGTPTFLIEQMKRFKTDITTLDEFFVSDSSLQRPTQTLHSALPLLFQTGYLSIKAYDRESFLYHVGIPNEEVRIGLTEALLPAYSGLNVEEIIVAVDAYQEVGVTAHLDQQSKIEEGSSREEFHGLLAHAAGVVNMAEVMEVMQFSPAAVRIFTPVLNVAIDDTVVSLDGKGRRDA